MSGAERMDASTPELRVEVRRGRPTDEELAATLAVVTAAYAQEAASAVADDEARPSAWQLSRRAMRTPLRRDLGWTHGSR